MVNDNDYSAPFVSTPLSTDSAIMPASSMSFGFQSNMMDNMESEYPEIYHEVYPLVVNAANQIMAAGYSPTSQTINLIVDAIIKNSGLWYEDDDSDNMAEAMPVQLGFGQNPFRRRRRHHNRNTLRDIIRILLLRELFDRR